MAESSRQMFSWLPRMRRNRWLLVGGLLGLLWLVSGLRQVDPVTEYGVIEGFSSRLLTVRTERSWVLAPPGLFRLSRYPRRVVELSLPEAETAWLPGPDGSRYGLKGWAMLQVRSEQWRLAHESSRGRGLSTLLLDALREAEVPFSVRWRRAVRVPPDVVRQVQTRLAASLERRGVDLRGFNLTGFDFLKASPQDPHVVPKSARLLVVGLDGADWEIIDPLMEQGKLPNLKGLIERGVRGKLLSISPMLSPVIWTTVATGVEPSRHGILDFLVPDPAGGQGEPVTSSHRRTAALWQILSRRDVPVGVVGWWASWPAEPVNGYLISDRIAYQLFGYRSDAEVAEGKVWPPELYPKVRSVIVDPESVDWNDVLPYLEGSRTRLEEFDETEAELLKEFRTLLASGRTYRNAALALRQEMEPAFETVYFEGTDTIGHLFMKYRPPRLPGVDVKSMEAFRGMVDRYYQTVDGYLGDLLSQRGEEWTVLVLSDHGFASDANRPRTTDSRIGHGAAADWHRRFGVLILSGAHVNEEAEITEASIYDIAPTVLALFAQPVPASWPGRVLAEALDAEFFEAHPVRYRMEDPPRGELMVQTGEVSDPAAGDVLEKLESLGYISSAGGDSKPSLTTRNNAGVSLMAEGKYGEAEEEFRAALEDQPDHPVILVNLGAVLRFQRRTEEARELLVKALAFPTAKRAAGNQLAQLCLEAGELDCAERHLRQVLSWEPGAAEARTTLGLVLEERGDRDGARKEYLLAVGLDAGAAMARNNLGNLAKQDGKPDEAEQWYLEAIEADPYFMGAYNNLALIYQDEGEILKAIDLYSRAHEKAPGNAIVLNNLASLHYATADMDEARRLWGRAVRLDPTYPSPYNNLAGLAIAGGRLEEAEKLLQQALKLDEDYGDAHINLALVHRARGDRERSRQELEKAARDPAARPKALEQLGLMELEGGKAGEALMWLTQARKLDGRSIAVLNGLGHAYHQLGKTPEAREAWAASLSLEPAQEAIRRSLDELEGDS